MKFINGTLSSARSPSDKTPNRLGRMLPAAPVDAPKAEPEKVTPDAALKEYLRKLEPEPSTKLKGRLVGLANTPAPDKMKQEVEDILSILRSVGKK